MSTIGDILKGALNNITGPIGITGPAQSAEKDVGAAATSVVSDTAGLYNDASKAVSDVGSFLSWISWIFHPLNLLRVVEFTTGIGTLFFGLGLLVDAMKRSSMTHRSNPLGRLFNRTPVGRVVQTRRARRRGRRAGQVQAERDVAYRGARQERARKVGAGRRTTPGSTGGTGGTGQGSSALE